MGRSISRPESPALAAPIAPRWERRVVLTIAGSDSSGGAGIQADLKTIHALGAYGTCALTAVTAQNTLGVAAVHAVPPEAVGAQMDAVLSDLGADGLKTGMLASAEIVHRVAERVRSWSLGPRLVVDPVLVSSTGQRLLDKAGERTLLDELLPQACLVTPNIPEAEVLVGARIQTVQDMADAAKRLAARGANAVLVKGGHAREEETSVDVLFDGERVHHLEKPRLVNPNTHGTGCTLSAAIATYLALDFELESAVTRAKDFVWEAIRAARPLGHGPGPLAHEWQRSLVGAYR